MTTGHDPQVYFHVRVVMGMVLGLSVARLLSGFAKFIQHPQEHQANPLHLGWAASTLLGCVLFWWWEYRLAEIGTWTFFIYLFVLIYCSLFYFMCVILFPDHLGEYPSYRAYFYAKRPWFFGILAFSYVMDVGDTFLKGQDYVAMVGLVDGVEAAVMGAGCLVAMRTRNPNFHGAFLILTLVGQCFWIGWLLNPTS
ncbi:hypothetical protein [Aquabacter spiritensis]|uniref:Uncharacterized protein n=1 Tax=Aquabacter spiritensis TaxID=933073 RepID=A0A4R3LTV3_9HYPH|nr:hypothetical protein [Aquabacter spiritensis]TCT02075.1 hypothetical protein EDC64_115106 [Aquabacter spiritensis]